MIQEKYSIAEYLQLEENNEFKSEFTHGMITAMSGGTLNHGIIGSNANSSIHQALNKKGSPCISFNSDTKVYIEEAASFVYPDGMVICGEIEISEHDPHSVINPVLIIEVLSKSTGSYDRGDKFHKYCSLASFKEYILIDQNKPVVDILYRADASYWKMTTFIGLDKSVYINILDIHIPMEFIYRNAIDLAEPRF